MSDYLQSITLAMIDAAAKGDKKVQPMNEDAARRVRVWIRSQAIARLDHHFKKDVQEACVPNKTGKRKGSHDDETGHPCSTGHTASDTERVRHTRRDNPRHVADAMNQLDSHEYRDNSVHTEAMVAALNGHRWKSKNSSGGYDTDDRLSRWIGADAEKYGNPVILEDVKSQTKGVGYADKLTERFNKAQEATAAKKRSPNGFALQTQIVATPEGLFLTFGVDPQSTTPQYGEVHAPEKNRRGIVGPGEIGKHIDGKGGILPAVRLSSSIKLNPATGGLVGYNAKAIAEYHNNKRAALNSALENGMENMQKQLDVMNSKAKQALGKKMATDDEVGGSVVAEMATSNQDALKSALSKLSDEQLSAMGLQRHKSAA